MKKGISLSIETVIVLILAVLVLVVVLFFFMSGGSKPMNEIQARAEQDRWCSAYAQIDPDCKTQEVDANIKKGIAGACSKLQVSSCAGLAEANLDCILRCCGTYCKGKACSTNEGCSYCDPTKRKICYNLCSEGRCKMDAFVSCSQTDC